MKMWEKLRKKKMGSYLRTSYLKSIPLNAEVFFNGKSIGSADKKITYAPADDYSVKFVYQKRELAEKFAL